jgi:pyrroline-5-carboxylate reductase
MAEAIVVSLLKARLASPSEVFASDSKAERRQAVKKRHGVNTYASNRLVAGMAPVVFLAVKPQDLEAVLREIAPVITSEHLVISIAAGKTIAWIEALLPRAKVVRVMPNMACLVSEAMSVFALGRKVSEMDKYLTRKLLSSFGRAMELPEEQFDIVTALSGSGPAFLAYLAARMVDAAVAEGLDRDSAIQLALQTMLGTGKLMLEKGMEPGKLIEAVASPGGTTAAGLKVLEGSDVAAVLRETMGAARRRSRELSAGG